MSAKREDTPSILIGNEEGTHVAIRPLHGVLAEARDPDDANRLESRIEVEVGAFKGALRSGLRAEDFPPFLAKVRVIAETLSGTAELASLDQQFQLALEGNGRGQTRVAGRARDGVGTQNELKFEFEIDQSYVTAIVRTVEEVVARFPVQAPGRRDARGPR